MNNKFGLSDRTVNTILNYFTTKPEIKKVVLYGSRAKGNYKTGSDIDFAVWTDSHSNISAILNELDELQTPYKFDVTDYLRLEHTGMKQNIDNDGIVFYEVSK